MDCAACAFLGQFRGEDIAVLAGINRPTRIVISGAFPLAIADRPQRALPYKHRRLMIISSDYSIATVFR